MEGNGKREGEMIEILFHEVAANAGDVNQAPVVTPDLVKKIETLCFAGTNTDDLSNEINLFLMVILDHTFPDNEKAHFASLSVARDHDDLVTGSTAMDFTNLKLLCATVKLQVLTAHAAWLMLKACTLILATFLGDTRPVVTDLAAVMTPFMNKENFCIRRLQVADGLVGPVHLVHHVQLQAQAWFLDIASCTAMVAVASVMAPDFDQVWHLRSAAGHCFETLLVDSHRMICKFC